MIVNSKEVFKKQLPSSLVSIDSDLAENSEQKNRITVGDYFNSFYSKNIVFNETMKQMLFSMK